ncbi:MAG: hypothetical protein EAZ92_13385 [Candidatus Kapaibacterium sp.]|nr:MAG: hypothetical protein EAZ92_13385 [Candidatus Kapabacteria bacterium]
MDISQKYRAAETLMQQRDFKAATAAWSEIVRSKNTGISPEQKAYLLLQRGCCYYELRADTSAIIDFSTSLELVPHHATFYERARSHFRKKMLPFALSDIEKALALSPDNADYYVLRGNIHFEREVKSDGCADFAMARSLGLSLSDDISLEPCRLLGVPLLKAVVDSTQFQAQQKTTKNVADTTLLTLLSETNSLNTQFYRWSLQAQAGGTSYMLSRLYYDVRPGFNALGKVGYSVNRNWSAWLAGMYSEFPYTHGSERLRMPATSPNTFGEVSFAVASAGGQYSVILERNLDLQFGLGIGYKRIQFPSTVPITYVNGEIAFPNRGIAASSGFIGQAYAGVEWRFLRNVALIANGSLNLSATRYNYMTLTRIDIEAAHQFVNYLAGIRVYFDEQSE